MTSRTRWQQFEHIDVQIAAHWRARGGTSPSFEVQKLFESSVCNAIHFFLRIIDYANKNVSRNLADEPAYLKDLIKHRSPAQGRQQHK
ncbi:hypothetical protein AW033_05845 [Vibrio parahaemolyticus]|nr:hypothetical protein AW033_05845 [Vibrio parahaemolyticus]